MIVGVALIGLVIAIYGYMNEPPPPLRGSTPLPPQAAAAQGAGPGR